MCPYTLDHNKMLASTMQHSTHNHTPNPTTATTPTQDALEDRTRSGTKKTPQNRCPLRTQQRAKPPRHQPGEIRTSSRSVPPSHTHTPPTTAGTMLDTDVESVKGDPQPTRRPTTHAANPLTSIGHTINLMAP
jgi:hypothetical protein